ncbi:MAG: ergothioneine biosynthesis protein EgtB [Casimicrobiaceae bacterium]
MVETPHASLLARFRGVRTETERLIIPLTAEDCQAQSMPDASPVKWHLAHTTWFFETFVLERFEHGFRPFAEAFRVLFNSYYDAVGDRHPRPLRGLLTRPTLEDVRAWRAQVDARITQLLMQAPPPEACALIELGCNHEEQHQELILTDLKHLFSQSLLAPAYRPRAAATGASAGGVAPIVWLEVPDGCYEIGHPGVGFAFDNEGPRHRVWLARFALAHRLVSHAEWAEFIADGGYRNPSWWLSEGWDWVASQGVQAPLYWQGTRAEDPVFTLHGLEHVDPSTPVAHVSYYEADAYARWRGATDPHCAGARLPTEAEWEVAVSQHRPTALAGGHAEAMPGHLHPQPAGCHVAPGGPAGCMQVDDTLWQWTSSSYAAYPGYRPPPGAVGEYNGKFMVNQYVLRGGSFATPPAHRRLTYRNFFPSGTRWQFTGVRLARDI